MLRVARFQDGEYAGQVYHTFKAKGVEQVIMAFASKREGEYSSWLSNGTMRGALKGTVEDFAEMFEDEFGYTMAEQTENGEKVLYIAPIDEVAKGGDINWIPLNDCDNFILRRLLRTDNWYLTKRYHVLNPNNENYGNHINDACTRDGVLSWLNIFTGEVQNSTGCPGKNWYNFYCEVVRRRTDNDEPYYCFGDKEISEKFIEFCKTHKVMDEQEEPENTTSTEEPKNKKESKGPKPVNRKVEQPEMGE